MLHSTAQEPEIPTRPLIADMQGGHQSYYAGTYGRGRGQTNVKRTCWLSASQYKHRGHKLLEESRKVYTDHR